MIRLIVKPNNHCNGFLAASVMALVAKPMRRKRLENTWSCSFVGSIAALLYCDSEHCLRQGVAFSYKMWGLFLVSPSKHKNQCSVFQGQFTQCIFSLRQTHESKLQ